MRKTFLNSKTCEMHYAIPVLPQMMRCSVAYFKRFNVSSLVITIPMNDLKNIISLLEIKFRITWTNISFNTIDLISIVYFVA